MSKTDIKEIVDKLGVRADQLADDIELLAKNDPIGRDLQDLELRKRASGK